MENTFHTVVECARSPKEPLMAKRSEADDLMQRIAEEFEALPRQLQGVARYLEEHRSSIMVQRVGEIAEGCGVHASAVVRFAQRFGYSGFTEMQAVFRNAFTAQNTPAKSYQQGAQRRHDRSGNRVALHRCQP
jgi:DNA-binding MurR/RpiR family transcriptional regulator